MASGIDIIARGLGARGLSEGLRANHRLDMLPNGLVYIGAVDYYTDLPSEATVGSVYTVKYKGTSGYVADGSEYVYGEYGGENQWIKLGPELPNMDSLMAYTEVHDINVEVQNGTASGAEFVETGSFPVIVTIVADEGYVLPEEITVNDQTGSSGSIDAVWSYDDETGEITLSNAVGAVDIVAVCEAEQPEPGALIPFAVEQTIIGYDFGNVENGDTNVELDEFLSNLDLSSEVYLLDLGSENGIWCADYGTKVLFASGAGIGDTPIYALETSGDFTRGYQNLVDGKIVGINYTIHDGAINTIIGGWNGVFIGAVEPLI